MLELRTIWKNGKPYLKRWRIFGYLSPSNSKEKGLFDDGAIESKLPFALRIHEFHQRDEDHLPHNHPWKWAISFIFRGGYRELRFNVNTGKSEERILRAPAINFIRHGDYHMVTELFGKPMTLFLTGPKTSSWGFLDTFFCRHIPWKEFLGVEEKQRNSEKTS